MNTRTDKMLRLLLIRHGETPGNLEKRYIGRNTDEDLSPEGEEALKQKQYPECRLVYVSPMKRCRRTAELLFPGAETVVVPELTETDFGSFENKNYMELSGDPDYQAWIDSGGTMAFPGGDSPESFRSQALAGFHQVLKDCCERGAGIAAVVTHGGTIMQIMGALTENQEDLYKWHVGNGEGFEIVLETGRLCSFRPVR